MNMSEIQVLRARVAELEQHLRRCASELRFVAASYEEQAAVLSQDQSAFWLRLNDESLARAYHRAADLIEGELQHRN